MCVDRNRLAPAVIFPITIIATALVLLFSLTIYSQSEPPLRVNTNIVIVPVSVIDRDGRFVSDLKQDDFRIFEDGIQQEIELFESTSLPITIYFLVDMSGSMTKHVTSVNEAINTFVRQLRPDDQVAVASFADFTNVLIKPTKVSTLQRSIQVKPRVDSHFTRIYDGVHDVLKAVKKIKGRKTIVMFSDGAGDGTYASASGNLRDAEEGDATIYTVQFRYFNSSPPRGISQKKFHQALENATTYMQKLPQLSGGRYYHIEKITSLDEVFAKIVNELCGQYNLGYYPRGDGRPGEYRRITVRVGRAEVAVRSKNGYFFSFGRR